MKNPFIGTGVALVTPFRKQETIDFSKLESLINHIINGGADYIVALGTTSEAATMTDTERHALQDFIIESVGGRCPIMLGLGGNNTLAVTDAIANTNFDGISGILSVAPYYNKPNQRGLAQHFKQIADVFVHQVLPLTVVHTVWHRFNSATVIVCCLLVEGASCQFLANMFIQWLIARFRGAQQVTQTLCLVVGIAEDIADGEVIKRGVAHPVRLCLDA